MLISLLIGALIGFGLAIPPGPVAVTTIKNGLEKEFSAGVKFAAGAGVLDVIYCIIAMLAASAVIKGLETFFVNHPFATVAFQLILVIALIIYGIVHVRSTNVAPVKESPTAEKLTLLMHLKEHGPFWLGVAIALTNLANPSFLPALTYLSFLVKHSGLIEENFLNSLLYSIGFGVGNFLWLYLILKLIKKYKHRLSSNMMIKINHFAGYTIIGFGVLIGIRIFLITKWTDLLQIAFNF